MIDDIIAAIGKENTIALCKLIGGCRLYIPKASSLFRKDRDQEIYSEFTGYNFTQLAKKYELSDTHIRRIIKQEKEKE